MLSEMYAASMGQWCHLTEGPPLVAVLHWMVGCLSRKTLGKGVLAPSWANMLFKMSSLVGDEVPHLRWPAFGPLFCLVGSSSWPLGS